MDNYGAQQPSKTAYSSSELQTHYMLTRAAPTPLRRRSTSGVPNADYPRKLSQWQVPPQMLRRPLSAAVRYRPETR
jgi:hypothetical protein